MTASERLDEIQARYSEWHQDRGHHTPAPETDTWSDADHPDESMDHCIVRNDVPPMASALRAVLDLHRPVEVEPSDTICGDCSFQLPNGRYFGKVEEWPCDTVRAVEAAFGSAS